MCGSDRVGCRAIQQSDQMYCDRCGLVWDMNDPDPPECNITRYLPGVVHEVEITGTFSVDPDEERQKIHDILDGSKEP